VRLEGLEGVICAEVNCGEVDVAYGGVVIFEVGGIVFEELEVSSC
jgi:hypothetical protein